MYTIFKETYTISCSLLVANYKNILYNYNTLMQAYEDADKGLASTPHTEGQNGKNPRAIINYWLTEELVPECHL